MTGDKKAKRKGASQTSEPAISLDSTVSTFSNRLKRKLKEQEVKEDATQRDAEARHALMLQAMNTIRKALLDTSKIRLGDRFRFALAVDDWEGWPRVRLNLIDNLAPELIEYALVVSANDRNQFGTILITERNGKLLGKLQLCEAEAIKKLPLLLKKTVRKFLDQVADYVLNPKKPEDLLDSQTQIIEVPELDEIDQSLQKTDVFTDDDHDKTRENVLDIMDDPDPISSLPSATEEVEFSKEDNLVKDEEEVKPLNSSLLLND